MHQVIGQAQAPRREHPFLKGRQARRPAVRSAGVVQARPRGQRLRIDPADKLLIGGHPTKRRKSKDASWTYMMVKHAFPDLGRAEREALILGYQQEHIHPLRSTFCLIYDAMLLPTKASRVYTLSTHMA